MLREVEDFTIEFLKESKDRSIRIISHYETDGISSSAILIKTLKRLDKKFSICIIKELTKEFLDKELKRNSRDIIFFLGLPLKLENLKKKNNKFFIINNNQVENEIDEDISILNPSLPNSKLKKCTVSQITYLFSKTISKENLDLSKIALVGFIQLNDDKETSDITEEIIKDTKDLIIKEGLILYPSTRPLKRSLEYSISPYIPGITGNQDEVINLLKKVEISPEKSLIDLDEKEMLRLVSAIKIKLSGQIKQNNFFGKLYTANFFGRMEDLREIAVIISACSRLGYSDIAISFALENESAKSKALDIYTEYKTELVSGLKTVENIDKINGRGFVILNAGNKIKDAIVGTICSMLSSSPTYEEGTILIGMAYNKDKIKIFARIAGKGKRNIREVFEKTAFMFESEHPETKIEFKASPDSASCLIQRQDELSFIETLKKNLEVEIIKI